MIELSQARLRELLHYNPDNGLFTRLVSWGTGKAGNVSASLDTHGYVQIRADCNRYRGHRLAWLYMTGNWPRAQIDHINGIRNDNRWCNLREATQTQNTQNSATRRTTPSGLKGVTVDCRLRWRARITVGGKQLFLGYFDNPIDAYAAYTEAANLYFRQFARLMM